MSLYLAIVTFTEILKAHDGWAGRVQCFTTANRLPGGLVSPGINYEVTFRSQTRFASQNHDGEREQTHQ